MSEKKCKVAVIGSGISGLAAAHALNGQVDITLFESGNYFGGHTNTVDITLPTKQGLITHGVDTGFLVFNERTYPNLIKLFADLDVKTAKSDMSFSVQVSDKKPASKKSAFEKATLEWSGTSLSTVFAQRSNLVNLDFWRMLLDLKRFNEITTKLALQGQDAALKEPLADFLKTYRFSEPFKQWYLLPMLGCIWSCPTAQMLQFPVATMIRFCHNHGLLQISNRPQWWTVAGGAKHYVEKIIASIADKRLNTPVLSISRDKEGVQIVTANGAEKFNKVIIATHSDQALALLEQPSHVENKLLSAIHYQDNVAVLHTDSSVLPKNESAWAAWNYESTGRDSQVCLHYLINKLQPIPFEQPVVVSLNPARPIAQGKVLARFDYAHPVFDMAAIKAQSGIAALQGQQNTFFCGAWTGYGFHEDGLKSGLAAAEALKTELSEPQWQAAA